MICHQHGGGQRQLVAITAVLASNKQLLLLDEALSNLDWVSRLSGDIRN